MILIRTKRISEERKYMKEEKSYQNYIKEKKKILRVITFFIFIHLNNSIVNILL